MPAIIDQCHQETLRLLHRKLPSDGWQFNVWFHGKTGKPSGVTGQALNAATFLLTLLLLLSVLMERRSYVA